MKKLFLLLFIVWMGMTQTYAIELTQAEKDSIAVSIKSIQDHTELLRMQFDSLSNDADSMKTSTAGIKKNVSDLEDDIDLLYIIELILLISALLWFVLAVNAFLKKIRKKG